MIQKLIFYTIVFCSTLIGPKSYGQTIAPTNTVPPGIFVNPIDWVAVFGTPDVSNETLMGGVSLWAIPTVYPPNGHEQWISGCVIEQTHTMISDLIIGADYEFTFYTVEQRTCFTAGDGIFEVQIGDEITEIPFTGGDNPVWETNVLTFTATATEMGVWFRYVPEYWVSCHFWNVSVSADAVELACDPLTTEVSDTEVCFGDAVTLSAEAASGAAITWDGGVSNGVPFTPPIGTTTYTATSELEDDCIFEVEITVYDYPVFDIIADDDEICEGESVTLSIDGDADAFSWDPDDIISDVPFYPESGFYTYSLTGINGVCESSAEIDITVHENPPVDATSDESSYCLGDEIVLTGTGADEYVWEDGVIDGEPFIAAELGTTAYNVEGTDLETGCSNSDFIYVTVYDNPAVVANADDDSVCEGEMVTLFGSGASSFEWDLGVVDDVPFIPPLGTTTYTVIGTSIVGCQAEASIDITVYTSPEVSATASEIEICEGDEVILTGDGADIYEWDSGVTDGEPFVPEGVGAITYSLTGIDDAGCEGTTTIEIFVHPSPTVTALATPAEICDGESTVLTASGADVFAWEDGIIDGVAYTPGGIGEFEYTVTGTDTETGCANTADVTVVVHENPTVTANATLTELCLGESTILTGDGAAFYFWEDGVVDGASFTPTSLGTHTYVVTGISDEGCENSAAITIDVLDCVPVHAGFEMPNEVCLNDCITITDTSLGNVVSWSWEFSAGIEPGTASVQDPTICLNEPGTYAITLNVVAFNGAESTHTQDLLVNENPIIDASTDTIIDLGGTANLIGTTTSEGDYFWSPEKLVDCPDCQITTTSPEETQTYTLLFIDENGCKAEDQVLVMVNYRLSVGVPTAFSPNGDGNNDVLFVKGLALKSIYFTVYNRYGEQIFETTNQNIGWDGTFKNRDQNPGVFSWVLQYETFDGKSGKLKGNTTLIR